MKRSLLLLFAVLPLALAQDLKSISRTATGSITAANASCIGASCVWIAPHPNTSALTVQLSGTFTATVQFEATITGATWSAIAATNGDTSATATGSWAFSFYGYQGLRVRSSAFTSGPVVVAIGSAAGTYTGGGAGWSDDGTTITAAAGRDVAIGTATPLAPASPCNVSALWAANVKTVTPQMCGALANDSHDDKTAIDAAIATGLPVHFPAGTYKYAGKMSALAAANRKLIGDGSGLSIIHFTDSTVTALVEMTAATWGFLRVSGLTFKGPGVGAGSNVHGIYSHDNLSAPYDVEFNDVRVTDVSGNGFYLTDAFMTRYLNTWVERVGGDGHNLDGDQSVTMINSGRYSTVVGGYCWTIKSGAPFMQGMNCGGSLSGGGAHFGNTSPASYAHPTIIGMNIEGMDVSGKDGIHFDSGSSFAYASGVQIYCNNGVTCANGIYWANLNQGGIWMNAPQLYTVGTGSYTNKFFAVTYGASGSLLVLGDDPTANSNSVLQGLLVTQVGPLFSVAGTLVAPLIQTPARVNTSTVDALASITVDNSALTGEAKLLVKTNAFSNGLFYRRVEGQTANGSSHWAAGQYGEAEDTYSIYTGTSLTKRAQVDSSAFKVIVPLRLGTVAAYTCNSTTRGDFNYIAGGAGVKDIVQVCGKDVGDSYAWRAIY